MGSQSAGIGSALPDQNGQAGNILTTDGTTASWEVSSSSLPSQGGNSGKYLTTNGTVASWASVSSSLTVGTPAATGTANAADITAGVLTLHPADGTNPGFIKALATVGSTPAAAGASLGTDGTLTLQPADGTHGGVVSTSAQTLAGSKTLTSQLVVTGAAAALTGTVQATMALFFGSFGGIGVAGLGANTYICMSDLTDTLVNAPSGVVYIKIGNAAKAIFGATNVDMTGLGNGGAIKLKSPDGTTYTASIANGGTWSIS